MPFIDFNNLDTVKVLEGVVGQIIDSDSHTFGRFSIKKGTRIPQHSHPHEQWTHLIEGELEFTIDGETRLMQPGMVAHALPHEIHAGLALSDCLVIDCFCPARAEFVNLEKMKEEE